MDGRGDGRDLVVVSLPGVQRFIEEARSTSDVSAASEIYAVLAERAVDALGVQPDGELVLPARRSARAGAQRLDDGTPGAPNRIVALFPAGEGVSAARRASAAIREQWYGWVGRVLASVPGAPVPETPGFPCVVWVCVPAGPGGYETQWRSAQRLLAARRRVRDFPAAPEDEWRRRALCSLAPRWPAEPGAPRGVPDYEQKTPLSAVGWVKRRWRDLRETGGFPSTASIASAPYRAGVLQAMADPDVSAAVAALDNARTAVERALKGVGRETPVPGLAPLILASGPGAWFGRSGGPWVYPERWQADSLVREAGLDPAREGAEKVGQIAGAVADGRKAARTLRDLMAGSVGLAAYLAVVVQDLDSMGLFLGGKAPAADGSKIGVNQDEHGRVSRQLLRVGQEQRAVLRMPELMGVPVYAGGDDLLAFVPASRALAAARTCHDKVPPSLPAASTAVLFFHYHASIQQAMREARAVLKKAKEEVRGKHALAVGYLRRSGVSAVSIQPWTAGDGNSADLFGLFGRGAAHRLSPRLVADLERDADELSGLARIAPELYRQELTRLVWRHGDRGGSGPVEAARQVASALAGLGEREHASGEAGGAGLAVPLAAARVGVFLRQEAQ